MPRVLIIPHRENEIVFSQLLSRANACQGDFTFHTLPPDDNPVSPLRAVASDFRPILLHLAKRKAQLGAQESDLLVAFFDGRLDAHEAHLTNLFMAGSRYDEPTPCNGVISLQFLSWRILAERFNFDLQRHAFLHLIICGLLGAYTHVDAHPETHGCLFDFNACLYDFNRKLERGYYLCGPDENDCYRRVQMERFGNSIIQLCSTFKYGIDRNALQIIMGDLVMGDKFEKIKNATIINRSNVIGSFNRVRALDERAADALLAIAEAVEASGNQAAASLFNSFSEEATRPNHDKAKLTQFWDGLIAVLPSVATLSESVAKITAFFFAR